MKVRIEKLPAVYLVIIVLLFFVRALWDLYILASGQLTSYQIKYGSFFGIFMFSILILMCVKELRKGMICLFFSFLLMNFSKILINYSTLASITSQMASILILIPAALFFFRKFCRFRVAP